MAFSYAVKYKIYTYILKIILCCMFCNMLTYYKHAHMPTHVCICTHKVRYAIDQHSKADEVLL